jgi:hypothetical protein
MTTFNSGLTLTNIHGWVAVWVSGLGSFPLSSGLYQPPPIFRELISMIKPNRFRDKWSDAAVSSAVLRQDHRSSDLVEVMTFSSDMDGNESRRNKN